MATKTKTKNKTTQSQQSVPTINADEFRSWIEVAAYYRAERRGFQGDPSEDWLAAEQELQQQFVASHAQA
jgi:hypothetical protein